jgi:hypothetical protein
LQLIIITPLAKNKFMKKLILTVFVLSILSLNGFAQKDKTKIPDYTNYYLDVPSIQTDEVTISFEDVVSKMGYCKLKIRIKNNTPDYILYKCNESVFNLDKDGYQPSDKDIIIKPFESDSKVLDVKGNGKCLVDSFILLVNGLYRFSALNEIQPTSYFFLPPSVNTFAAGTIACTMTDIKKETQETWVRFSCHYSGENAGIIDADKAVARLENGQEFAVSRPRLKPSILMKGESDKISLYFSIPANIGDMQFANMQIDWKNTFIDSKFITLPSIPVKFNIDTVKTQTKNK